MTIKAESILRVLEAVGAVLGKERTDNMLLNYRVEDLEKKLENAEKEIESLMKGGAYDKVRK